MKGRILSPEDADEWDETLASVEDVDVFHRLEHLNVLAEAGEEPRLFRYGDDENFVAYSFLKRTVNGLDFVDEGDLDATYYDLITGEYAGPAYRAESVDSAELLRSFRSAFETYCGDHNVVAEFGRLHPFVNSEESSVEVMDARTGKDIVYVDLRKDEDQIFTEMQKSKQKQVRSARDDLTVEISEDWPIFKEMYDATMARVDAKERYLYEDSFFERLFSELQDYSVMFIAYKDDQPVSGMIALLGERYIHSYLSCSYGDYLDLHGNVLLKYETIEYGKETGRAICNFGGGIEGSNTVFQFKKEFSETTAPFYTYRHVHDEQAYEAINDLKRAEVGAEAFEEIDFFPRYRGPS